MIKPRAINDKKLVAFVLPIIMKGVDPIPFDNLTTQTNIFTSNLKTAIAESATPAMETLAGTMRFTTKQMSRTTL